jgi:hypothetical protein
MDDKPQSENNGMHALNDLSFDSEKYLGVDEDTKWIASSGLMERAYLFGMIKLSYTLIELGVMPADNQLIDKISRRMLKTMFYRSADDSFKSTLLGQLYDQLKRSHEEMDRLKVLESTNEINAVCKHLQSEFEESVSFIQEQTKTLQAIHQRWDLAGRSEALSSPADKQALGATDRGFSDERAAAKNAHLMIEDRLRFIALLQTSHKLNDRF